MPLASITMYNAFLPALIAQYKLVLIEVGSIQNMTNSNRKTAIAQLRRQASALEAPEVKKRPTVGGLGAIGIAMKVVQKH